MNEINIILSLSHIKKKIIFHEMSTKCNLDPPYTRNLEKRPVEFTKSDHSIIEITKMALCETKGKMG
jgi:hypothetical protein